MLYVDMEVNGVPLKVKIKKYSDLFVYVFIVFPHMTGKRLTLSFNTINWNLPIWWLILIFIFVDLSNIDNVFQH